MQAAWAEASTTGARAPKVALGCGQSCLCSPTHPANVLHHQQHDCEVGAILPAGAGLQGRFYSLPPELPLSFFSPWPQHDLSTMHTGPLASEQWGKPRPFEIIQGGSGINVIPDGALLHCKKTPCHPVCHRGPDWGGIQPLWFQRLHEGAIYRPCAG